MKNNFPSFHQSFELLFKSEEAEVVYCYECRLFHVHYGTVVLDLSVVGMNVLIKRLHYYFDLYKDKINPKLRTIEVETPFSGIRLLLSVMDLKAFKEMLEKANLELEDRNRQRALN
ncbi:MAG: hypothetical protein AAGD05_07560 [Bacteroidota bacterium]